MILIPWLPLEANLSDVPEMALRGDETSSGKRLQGSPPGKLLQQAAKRPPQRRIDSNIDVVVLRAHSNLSQFNH